MSNIFYFGQRASALLGILHAPVNSPVGQEAILFCYPSVEEYMRAIWPCRTLCEGLARRGFFAMRFDYFGTGDSFGELTQAHPEIWIENIMAAADELISRTLAEKISFVGVRFGATLLSHLDFSSIKKLGAKPYRFAMWDPVETGRKMLQSFEQQEEFRLKHARHNLKKFKNPARAELLGYEISPKRQQSTENIHFNTQNISNNFDKQNIFLTNSGNLSWERQLNLEDGFLQPKVTKDILSFFCGEL